MIDELGLRGLGALVALIAIILIWVLHKNND